MASAYILFSQFSNNFFSGKLSQGHTAVLHKPEPWSTNSWTCGLWATPQGYRLILLLGAYWTKCIARASWRWFVPYRHQHSLHTDQELIIQEKNPSKSTKQNKERRAPFSKFSLIGITETGRLIKIETDTQSMVWLSNCFMHVNNVFRSPKQCLQQRC